jgi:hypothetical protein
VKTRTLLLASCRLVINKQSCGPLGLHSSAASVQRIYNKLLRARAHYCTGWHAVKKVRPETPYEQATLIDTPIRAARSNFGTASPDQPDFASSTTPTSFAYPGVTPSISADGSSNAIGTRCFPGECCESATRTSCRISMRTCGASWNSAVLHSNRPASISTRANKVFARQAQSRSASRFSATGSRSGGNYEPWLGPLKDSLDDALIRYRE